MRYPTRQLAPVAVLMTVLALLAGCGAGNGVSALPKAPPPSSSPTPTDPGVSITGIDPSELSVTDATGTSPGVNLSFASPIYTVTSTAQLSAPTPVRLTLDNALPRNVPDFVVSRASAGQPWTYLPARLLSDQRHVQFATSHLSDFAVLVMDQSGALQSFQDDIRSRLGFDIDKSVKKPECEATDEARKDGYSVISSKGRKTVFWCFGFENGKRVLRVVNRRTQPIQVSHLDVPVLPPAVEVPKAWYAWLAVVGYQATFLAPRRTVTYDVDLEPTKRVLLGATADANAQSLRALQATTAALVARLNGFGAGRHKAVEVMAALLARPQCRKTVGQGSDKMLAGCFSRPKLVATFGTPGLLLAKLTTDPSTRQFLRQEFTTMASDVLKTVNENILVRRAKPDFTGFVGSFTGKGRTLVVNGEGLVFESSTLTSADGTTTTPQADVTYQLSEPRVENGVAHADAVITKVKIYDRKSFKGQVPKVGQTGTFRLVKGVVRTPFVHRQYCDGKAAKKGTCG
jgi:hypothetical protein